jgi:hypothetical protein
VHFLQEQLKPATICEKVLAIRYNYWSVFIPQTTEDGSVKAHLQILYGQYLILGAFGTICFRPKNQSFL